MSVMENPGALAGAAGVGMTFKAAELNVNPIHSTFDGEMHHAVRLDRLPTPSGNWSPAKAAQQRV